MSEIIDQIKDRIDLAELVREYVPELKKIGISWKMRCPFHQEKTPSFIVSPDKQIWHCFGCGKGGDAFGFIKEIEGLEFVDALRLLAKRVGIKLQRQDPALESERARLLDILRLSAKWYHQALLSAKSGQQARDYVKNRQVSDLTCDVWQIGFAPDAWDGLFNYLQSRGYKAGEIVRAGLAASGDRGGYYDRFRYRLMFPIADVHGSIVGFTGRKLKEDDLGGKYINTPETPLYHKSQILYGLSAAKDSIRQEDSVVIVEGNMDCLSSHQAGVNNVVASSGTALTGEQIKLIKRFSKNIILAFDPDTAGQDALMRGLAIAWQEDMIINIISLPASQDPDTVIKKDPNLWRGLIKQAQNFMDWMFVRVANSCDLTTAQGKKLGAKILLPWISRLPDVVEQTHYLQLLSGKINVAEDVLRQVIVRRETRKQTGPTLSVQPVRVDVWDRVMVRLSALLTLLPRPAARSFLNDLSADWLPNPKVITLYKSLKLFYDDDIAQSLNSWLLSLSPSLADLGRAIVLLSDDLKQNLSVEEVNKELADLKQRLRLRFIKKQLLQIKDEITLAEKSGDKKRLEQSLSAWQKLNSEVNQ